MSVCLFDVIPAIDLRDGKCVRLVQGDYARETVYSSDPVAMAKRWEDLGARRLHVVDLDGAREGEPRNLDVAAKIARAISIASDIGGGIRSREAAQAALDAGFERFSIGTRALDGDFAAEVFAEFGDAAILDIAARDGMVSVAGWREQTRVKALDLARELAARGCRRIIFTDVSRDGALSGPNIEATRALAQAVDAKIIASGGVSRLEDVVAVAGLAPLGVEGVIVGKALYDGRLDLAAALLAPGVGKTQR